MKFFVAVCFLAVASVVLADTIKYIPVLERTEHHDNDGAYQLRYLTGDNTEVVEKGVLVPTLDGKDKVLIKEGTSTYTAPDGQVIRTGYIADLQGYRATGDHLPKSVVA